MKLLRCLIKFLKEIKYPGTFFINVECKVEKWDFALDSFCLIELQHDCDSYCLVVKFGLGIDVGVRCSLVGMYARCTMDGSMVKDFDVGEQIHGHAIRLGLASVNCSRFLTQKDAPPNRHSVSKLAFGTKGFVTHAQRRRYFHRRTKTQRAEYLSKLSAQVLDEAHHLFRE